jgi:hypothetical protein
MQQLTPRKLNALVLIGAGVLLLQAPEPLARTFANAPPLALAGIYALSPLGLTLFALGIYRFLSKGKS